MSLSEVTFLALLRLECFHLVFLRGFATIQAGHVNDGPWNRKETTGMLQGFGQLGTR